MIAIIVNPQAGNKDKAPVVAQLQHHAKALKLEYTLAYSEGPHHITNLIIERAPTCERVIIVGGDGSVQEAIEGLGEIGWPCALAIVPCGSGNDLARSLGLPTELDAVVKLAFTGKKHPLTIGRMNEHTFANIVSTGLDADIVALRNRLKPWLSGPFAYLFATVVCIVRYKPKPYQLVIDGVSYEGKYALVAIANGKYYGGGMMIAPSANPVDPNLNVVAIKGLKPFKLLSLLHLVYTGRHMNTPYVESYFGNEITINPTGKQVQMAINYDGELCHSKALHAYCGDNTQGWVIAP